MIVRDVGLILDQISDVVDVPEGGVNMKGVNIAGVIS